jgi:hypothetical protein
MSLPRIAVNPHSSTQKWICNWARVAGGNVLTNADGQRIGGPRILFAYGPGRRAILSGFPLPERDDR